MPLPELRANRYDAVVVGSGPNGLAAAITLARAGRSVLVLEAAETIGGGARTAELTLPGFLHDVCSAIHPLGLGSPFFRTLPLDRARPGVDPAAARRWRTRSTTARAVVLERSVERDGAHGLGDDGDAYRRLIGAARRATGTTLARRPARAAARCRGIRSRCARFGLRAACARRRRWRAARSAASGRARSSPAWPRTRSCRSSGPSPARFGLVLGMPRPRRRLAAAARRLAGASPTRWPATCARSAARSSRGARGHSLDDLPPARAILLDVTPRQLLALAGDRLPVGYRRRLERYRYGPGVFKIDCALDGPDPVARRRVRAGRDGPPRRDARRDRGGARRRCGAADIPSGRSCCVAQQSLFDPTRAPAGKHTLWAYCHVPNGSTWT